MGVLFYSFSLSISLSLILLSSSLSLSLSDKKNESIFSAIQPDYIYRHGPRCHELSNETGCWPSASEVEALKNAMNEAAAASANSNGTPVERTLYNFGFNLSNSILNTGDISYQAPNVAPAPLYSKDWQWGYGWGKRPFEAVMMPDPADDRSQVCFEKVKDEIEGITACNEPQGCYVYNEFPMSSAEPREICYAGIRNVPYYDGNIPDFLLWPTTPEEVSLGVKFAHDHHLCLAIVGTGQDYLGRNSCANGGGGTGGVLIRTNLLNSLSFNPDDHRLNASGTIKVGAGLTFGQVSEFASKHNRMLSTSWSLTDGVAGWTMGCGHGPFASSLGLGCDNLVEAEVVLANGTLVTASPEENTDLWWALRGGGGSAFGAVVSFTLRAHPLPEEGLTFFSLKPKMGAPCWGGVEEFEAAMRDFQNFSLEMDVRMTTQASVLFVVNDVDVDESDVMQSATSLGATDEEARAIAEAGCGMWIVGAADGGAFLGGSEALNATLSADQKKMLRNVTNAKNRFAYNVITKQATAPVYSGLLLDPNNGMLEPSSSKADDAYPGGLPSGIVSRGNAGRFVENVIAAAAVGSGNINGDVIALEIFNDLTGHKDSIQAANVSISNGYRRGLWHIIGDTDLIYPYAPNSYQNEAAYLMDNWDERLWGKENYGRLLDIKKKYDPEAVFWCHHCVGDTSDNGFFD